MSVLEVSRFSTKKKEGSRPLQQCCLCRAVLWQSCSLHSLHVMTGFTRLRLGLTVRC